MAEQRRPNSDQHRRGFRISLPGLLFLFVCASAGMAAFVSPALTQDAPEARIYGPRGGTLAAMLSVASIAAIVALLDQRGRMPSARECAAARSGRLALSLLLAATVVVELLAIHGYLLLPATEQWYMIAGLSTPEIVWIMVVLAAIQCLAGRSAHSASEGRFWRIPIGYALAVAFIAYVAARVSVMTYYIHIATAGIHAETAPDYRREGVYPDHAQEGYFTYLMANAAVVTLAIAIGLLAIALRWRTPSWARHSLGALGSAGLAFCAWYAAWFYTVEFHRISPDLYKSLIEATWVELAMGAGVLTIVCVWLGIGAAKTSVGYSLPIATREGWLGRLPAAVVACAALTAGVECLIMASVTLLSDLLSNGFESCLHLASILATSPFVLLTLAVFVAGVRLGVRIWKSAPMEVATVDLRRAALMSAAFLVVAAVAVPTFAAYGFSAWFGPWNQ